MTLTIVNGRVEDRFKPASRYAEIAAACRAMGMEIANVDSEKIDTLLESNLMWAILQSDASSTDFLAAGHLPQNAAYKEALVN